MDGLTSNLERAIADGGSGNAEIVRDLEAAFTGLVGAAHALCVCSGTAALIAALRAAGAGPGDRVAVSVLGPSMTGLAISAVGAQPLFLDCASPSSFGISPAAAADAIRAGVKAVILVPMWGYWDEDPAAVAAFRSAGVPIIVDAAQAPFLRLVGGLAETADVVCLSLHGRKPLKAGEGGVCLTSRPDLAERILMVRNFGQAATFTGGRVDPTGPFAARFGTNLKINALGAAWCLTQLADIEGVRTQLDDLREHAQIAFTQSGPGWREAAQAADVVEHGRYGLVAICRTPDAARDMARTLTARGVEVDSARYQYAPMTSAPYFHRYAGTFPHASRLTSTVVACRLEAFAKERER